MNNCPCCKNQDLISVIFTVDKYGNPITIYHCQTCCAFVPHYPDKPSNIVRHQADFHAVYWANVPKQQVINESLRMRFTIDFYEKYLSLYEPLTPILDLGGGRGLLTKALLDREYNAYGCDPSSDLVDCARGILNIPYSHYSHSDIASFIDDRRDEFDGKVGAIFLWHVIEHLEFPIDTLRALKPLLRPDGIIVAQGPMLDRDYIFPEHYFLHSESNISWMARELGMKILFLDALSPERFISFVFGSVDHCQTAINAIYQPETEAALGALFHTFSRALALMRDRSIIDSN